MAFINNKGHGYNDVASAVSFQLDTVSIPAAGAVAVRSRELGNRGMPRVVVFLRQTAGVVPTTATIEFSVANTLNKVKVWFPAGTAVPTPLNVPVLVPLEIPAKFVRVTCNQVAGQDTTVQVALMVAQ
jgi:hypothetical protein